MDACAEACKKCNLLREKGKKQVAPGGSEWARSMTWLYRTVLSRFQGAEGRLSEYYACSRAGVAIDERVEWVDAALSLSAFSAAFQRDVVHGDVRRSHCRVHGAEGS